MQKAMKAKLTQTKPDDRNVSKVIRFISAPSAVCALLLFGGAASYSAGYQTSPNSNMARPSERFGLAYGGALPQFDLQVPDTRGEAAADDAVQAGFNWARDLHENRVKN